MGRQTDPGGNRAVWVIIVLLIVILAVVGSVASRKKVTSLLGFTPGMRAVIVPTADASRTVIIPPCGVGSSVRNESPTTLTTTVTGTVTVQLPQGQGTRIVLIPMCVSQRGGATGITPFPASAFVPRPGTSLPPVGPAGSRTTVNGPIEAGAPASARFQVVVPAGSPIRTVVAAPCQNTSGPAQTILGTTVGSSTAYAPSC